MEIFEKIVGSICLFIYCSVILLIIGQGIYQTFKQLKKDLK